MMVDNILDRTVGDSREQAAITRPRFKHIFCLCRSCIDWPSGRACSGFRSDRMERWSGGLLKSSPLASHPNRCDTQLCWIWYGKKGQLAHSAVVSSDSGSPPNPRSRPAPALCGHIPVSHSAATSCQKWAAFPTQFARGIFLHPSTVAAVTPNLSALPGIAALANRFSSWLAHNQHWGAGRHICLPLCLDSHKAACKDWRPTVLKGSKVGQLM